MTFWTTLAAALLIGLVIGAASASDEQAVKERDTLKAQNASLTTELEALQNDLGERESELGDVRDQLAAAQDRLRRLTLRGEVPNFVGDRLVDAEARGKEFAWKFRTTSRVSDAPSDTVIAQTPRAGTSLKAGKIIQLVLAKKAPPSWKTLRVLSGGGGASKSDEFVVPDGKVRLTYTMSGDSNNAITLYRRPAEYVDLLVNDIGPTSGSTRLYSPGTYYLDVTGDNWTVEIQVYR